MEEKLLNEENVVNEELETLPDGCTTVATDSDGSYDIVPDDYFEDDEDEEESSGNLSKVLIGLTIVGSAAAGAYFGPKIKKGYQALKQKFSKKKEPEEVIIEEESE